MVTTILMNLRISGSNFFMPDVWKIQILSLWLFYFHHQEKDPFDFGEVKVIGKY